MVNSPVPLLKRAKQPSALLSLKYFPRELSMVTLSGVHPKKQSPVKQISKSLIIRILAKERNIEQGTSLPAVAGNN